MSGFNGSGVYVISGSGLPVVSGTTISSTVQNTLNTDLATGLSTCITKDGQTTTTAKVPFADTGLSTSLITFPAVQVPSSGANDLDDYEEGTWTPADGSGAGLSFTSVQANYTKIGNAVFVTATLTYPSTADGSNSQINGLPFTALNVGAGFLLTAIAPGGGAVPIVGIVTKNTTHLAFNAQTGAAQTNADLSTRPVYLSGLYFTA